jgi:Na+/H+ antiporter NhaD/arsenite permease-like protein
MRNKLLSASVLGPWAAFLLAAGALSPLVLLAYHLIGTAMERPASPMDYLAVALFALALALAVVEEFTGLRKSKPVVLAAGLVWICIAVLAAKTGQVHEAEQALRHNLLQYAELMLFLLVAMTYVNAMSERRLFLFVHDWLAHQRVSYRRLFWLSGLGAFFLSPLLDNLTTALLMGTMVVALGEGNPRFVALGCINVVVAANAGGVYSPFGDITTLMVWQQNIQTPQGAVDFLAFFRLFPPALVSFLVPAFAMSLALPARCLQPEGNPQRPLRGAWAIVGLFFATMATTVLFQSVLDLPAVIGMLTGLAYLQFYGYYLKRTHRPLEPGTAESYLAGSLAPRDGRGPFDIFDRVARTEWDTLLFLYGVALCVGGLGYLGHLELISDYLYRELGVTQANIGAGVLSAILENIPTMFMVLEMAPDMALGQWLLVTFTTGTGGSLLAIGSAGGVAMMGLARGHYTFWAHLKWSPVIIAGFVLAVLLHLWISGIEWF